MRTTPLTPQHIETYSRISISGHQKSSSLGKWGMNQVYAETEVRDRFDEESCRQLKIAHITGPLNILEKTYRSVEYLELPLSADGMRATHTIEAVLPLKDL
jgi:hypothetical protein